MRVGASFRVHERLSEQTVVTAAQFFDILRNTELEIHGFHDM